MMKTLYLALLAAWSFFPPSAEAQVVSEVQIADLRAHLFCEQSAQFSDDVIGAEPALLWNSIIGEGEGCSSNSTLVLVVVSGPADAYLGDVQIEFSAQVAGSEQVRAARTSRLGITRPDGFLFVPVWIYDTGCEALDLHAVVLGEEDTLVHERINFMCGE
jgi:hypothetical protein